MLLVDERAGSGELIPILPTEITETFHGEKSTPDVVIPGNGPQGEVLVAVEVKTVADLLSSETTGRIAGTQLPAMLAGSYQEVWFLSIGDYRAGVHGRLEVQGHRGWRPYVIGGRQVPYAYLEAFLVELQVIGAHVKQVPDLRHAACWLVCLHNWWQKPWDKHRAMRKIDRSGEVALMPTMDPVQKQIIKTAMSLPSIGYERAAAASEIFECPQDLATAKWQDWAKVPGVGPVIAKSIEEAWRARRKRQ